MMFGTEKLGTFPFAADINAVAVAVFCPPIGQNFPHNTAAEVKGRFRTVTFNRTSAGSLDSLAFIFSSTTPSRTRSNYVLSPSNRDGTDIFSRSGDNGGMQARVHSTS